MKKLFAIILVALFLFNTAGYYFVFSFNQYTIRREIHNLIKSGHFEGSCITLRITNPETDPEFKWVDIREFRYKGVLYDLCSEVTDGSVTIFKCFNDKEEDELISCFNHAQEFTFGEKSHSRAKHAAAMLHHVITLALLDSATVQSPLISTRISFISPFYFLFSIFHPPTSPPPEFLG
ncbi:MAG: hypothetical protein WCL00_01380 [Bacteroidota bacterium]